MKKIFQSNKPSLLLTASAVTIFAAVLLFHKLGQQAPTLYNWEQYTVWRILDDRFQSQSVTTYLQVTNGLMIDTARSPIVGLPIKLLLSNFGYTLALLRVWPAFLTLLGIVACFVFLAKVFTVKIATVTALLLCSSQALLVYGRTGTNTAPTLLAEIMAVAWLYYGLPKKQTVRTVLISFIVISFNTYFYAPIRFFTPFLLLLPLKWIIQQSIELINHVSPDRTQQKTAIIISTSILLGLLVCTLFFSKPLIEEYFHGRGEQVVSLLASDRGSIETYQNAASQIYSNSQGLLKLFFSIDTQPTLADYAAMGQLIHYLLVPFFFVGILAPIRSDGVRNFEKKRRLVLIWFLMTALPILFTSNLHVGRLFLSLPHMFLICAIGIHIVFQAFSSYIETASSTILKRSLIAGLRISFVIFFLIVISSDVTAYFSTKVSVDHNIKVLQEHSLILQKKQVVLVNFESSTLHFWEMFYFLRQRIHFIDSDTDQAIDAKHEIEQRSNGILIRNGGSYSNLTKYCNNSDTALVAIGGTHDQRAMLKQSCQTQLIQLY